MDILLDGVGYTSEVHGTYHQLDTSDTVMLGSANSDILVQVGVLISSCFKNYFKIHALVYLL